MRNVLNMILGMALVSCGAPTAEVSRVEPHSEGIFTHALNAPSYRMTGDTLSLYGGSHTDFFTPPSGTEKADNAPILMVEVDNTQPFTFSANVSPAFSEVYDAGALYVYANDDRWLKLAFEMDERGVSRVVTVRTEGASDDNNHAPVSQKSVYLKISSDTHTIGYYYSTDGMQWHLVRVYQNSYPPKIMLGLSTQSPKGEGINSHFKEVQLLATSVADFRLGE